MIKKRIVLLIDDDEDDRKLFIEGLREVDCTITCMEMSNGEKALRYLGEAGNELPDYIFLDLRMPGLSGRQCLIGIKKNDRLASIPVIVYTTSIDEEESIGLKKLGAAHFVSKPTSADDIYYLIDVVLSGKWT